ncbi:YggT family protein [Falsarthrobacter nasiphocae]|uniref:YggT family protein n=1 Tax=Falsarthrobacter nasiphocae TaxID=189863 RepID=A0AAE3YFZ0_9MICC|nr:YggT family protein [Falsarthrobacter nasiphocae]MDR6891311.1 YggT family protein [Falsarthrobacter nasiphocae]
MLFVITGILNVVLALFSYALLSRIVLDFIVGFAPGWRPKGFVLVFASAVYAVTDKPLAWVRRVVPPLSLGGVSLDLGFLLLYFAVNAVRIFLPLPA